MTADNETLRMLQDAAGGLAQLDGARVRILRTTPGSIDRAMWTSLAAQGWLSVMVAEADGGLGLGVEAAAVIAGRLGHGCLPEPYVAAGVMAPYILGRSPVDTLRARLLPKVLAGEVLATLAWQGEAGALALDGVQVSAAVSNRQVTLDGISRFVPAPGADAFVVLTRRHDGLALYWVDGRTPGLQVDLEPLADGTASGRLHFSRTTLPDANLIAGPAHAGDVVLAAVDLGLVAQSAELLGAMERILAMTLDYLRTRKQFGQAIGSFQSLQHRAVDLWLHHELARHALTSALQAVGNPTSSVAARGAAASSAKNRAAESAMLIAKQAIQLHGAIGTTDEYDLGLYVNRVVALVPWLGNAAVHRQRYGALAPARERVSAPA